MQKSILLCIVLGIVLFSNTLFAADSKGDCIIFEEGSEKGVIRSDYTNIYPQRNVEIAINNLKNYCCQNKLINRDRCTDNTSRTDGASSNILYDHLIDVGFRSLDGDKELYYSYPEEQLGDTNGEVWRKKITEYARNEQGALPIKIRSDFGKYRGFDMQGGVKITLQEQKECDSNQEQYDAYNTNRKKSPDNEQESQSSIGLAERYLIICHVAQCIKYNTISNYYQACKNIALQRIQDEMNYVEITAINQGLAGLVNNFNAYTQGYFVQGQLSQLLEKMTELNAGLTHINSKVHEMTKVCSS